MKRGWSLNLPAISGSVSPTMFTLQILGLGELRSSIVQLLPLSNIANLRCSKFSVSLTVSYSDESHFLVAAFQMFDPFFTIFSARDGNYNLNIDLQELSQIILEDDLFLTILVPSVVSSASLISLTSTFCFLSHFHFLIRILILIVLCCSSSYDP